LVTARIPTGGGFSLEAVAAVVPGRPGAVVCHPHPAFGGRFDNPLVVALTDGLSGAGWSALRFNFRGLGASGGAPTGGIAEHEDVAAAVDWLRATGAPKVALVGYSFGALMALKAIALGAPAAAQVSISLPTTIVGEDPARERAITDVVDRGVPSLFVGGDADQLCEIDRVRAWAARHPAARLLVLPGEGHFFAGAAERQVVAAAVEFLGEHLPEKDPERVL
jgi:alpha/beta superfamily hydrolase